ncbi:hypothetical protein J437_LFUL006587 [Ladona fulva]|uniref:Endonuclease/exonuclease/phosphatase domain-containing protein n=1 Tax=Ladona fulva TaxID=123851 RepID=A0A8K0K230_LADFU|nr:hypothetical protein J437_LFUL006587 [Ladona fulva]
MPFINQCIICKDILAPEKEIKCDNCLLPLHAACGGLTRNDVIQLKAQNRRLLLHGDLCANSNNNKVDKLVYIINELQIEELRVEQSSCANHDEVIGVAVAESMERIKRLRNFLLHNVPESTSSISNEVLEHDVKQLADILADVRMNCAVNECKVMRLGRRSQGKLRQLEVVFRQDSDALEFFRLVNIHKKVTRVTTFLCLETKHKINDLSSSMLLDDLDVIILTETDLKPSINNAELCLFNYNIYRKDRDINTSQKLSGGCVLIAVNKKLSSSSLSCHYSNVEQVYVSIQRRDVRLLVGAVYLPPKSCHDLFESHCSANESLFTNSRFSDILIAGDFNPPGTQWDFSQPSRDGINSPNGLCLK